MFDRLIRFSARLEPLAIAVSSGTEHLNYRDFDQVIDKVATALARCGIGAPALVGVSICDTYRHLLIILGCARLGVATVSVLPDDAQAMRRLANVSTVLGDSSAVDPDLLIDTRWLTEAFSAQHRPVRSPATDPKALGRVELSSGATDEPCPVGLNWALMDRRIEHTWTRTFGYERLLCLIGPESGSLPVYLGCWARGGCVLFGSSDPHLLARSLPVLRPTGMLVSPPQLALVLDALPEDATPLAGLHVSVAGERVSAALYQRATLRLGTVNVIYGSIEAGVCANAFSATLKGEGSVGWVTPWTEIEIVDENGRLCPADMSGRIRVRGPDVVDGEFGLAGKTSEQFRDGWFYPGDIGTLTVDGMLGIEGREDEAMCFGGQKLLPQTLEIPVLSIPGVVDAAAFAVADRDGSQRPWLAIVRASDLKEEAIGRALSLPDLPPVRIAWIDAIPRTASGKVRREALRDAARELVFQAQPAEYEQTAS